MAKDSRRCEGMSLVSDPETGEYIRDPETNRIMQRPCKCWAVKNSEPPRCINHLGRVRWLRRQQENFLRRHRDEMAELLSDMDIPELHPMDALLEAVRYSGGMVRALQRLVGELPIDPEVSYDGGGETIVHAGLYGPDHTGDAQPHVLVSMYGIWMDRHTRACKMALDAGIDERLVRNAEAPGQRLVSAFKRALDAVPLTDEQRSILTQAMAKEARAHLELPSG